MNRGWLLFGTGVALLVAGTLFTLLAAFATPGGPSLLLFAGAGLTFAGGYRCFTRSRENIAATAYERVGVERNPDGTVGEAGAETERSRSADIDYEPPDWDDPAWFEEPFWREPADHEPPGPDEGPSDWWNERVSREPEREPETVAPREREACAVLGVGIDADEEAVTTAYRDRVKETHPDHGGDETAFKRVQWAYEYLCEHHDY
ncbi:MAG: J domain-containing protein [Halobacteriales archaeon]|nr:J domain-containing protein [Halobacteriales archaeon]